MDQYQQWRDAMPSQPIKSCGRLDMATYLPDPVTVGRMESDRIRYVYFADESECVVVGGLCDFVAFRAADYDKLAAQLAAVTAQRDELLRAAKAVQELLGDDLDAPRIVDFRQACVRDLWDAFVEAIARAQPEQPQQPQDGAP